MEGTIGIFDVQISRVYAGVVGRRVSLNRVGYTGGMPILSPDGAAAAKERASNTKITFIKIIYLL